MLLGDCMENESAQWDSPTVTSRRAAHRSALRQVVIRLQTRRMPRTKHLRAFLKKRNVQRVPKNDNVPDAHQQESDSLLQQSNVLPPDLCQLLQIQPGSGSDTSVDGLGSSACPEPNSQQQNQKENGVHLIRTYVSKHCPATPADLDQNLQQHLEDLQSSVLGELRRLAPLLDDDVMGCVIHYYHYHIFDHLDGLLQNVSTTRSIFVLMKWIMKTYLSEELLGHPDLQMTFTIKNIDLLLFVEWEAKAKDRLLENVQKEVKETLENILQNDRTQKCCNTEEDYVRLYVDTIQCVEFMHKAAQNISSKLSTYVQEVCFQELLTFVKRYTAEQTDALRRKASVDQPETSHFLKTLKTCRELKQHVQTKARRSPILETLDNLEDFTLKLLRDIVTNIAETHLKNYFSSDSSHFSLFPAVQQHFPKRGYGLDEQKRVMDEAYKLIVRIYVKHLLKTNKINLEKCWSRDVAQTVREDAQQLHNIISDLAPGVQQQNLMLLKVAELADCNCNEALKLTAVGLQCDCPTMSEDPELLPALLKWKGLSKGEAWEVLYAIDHGHQPSCYSWVTWW